jgi:hypothetical protein
MYTAHHNGRSTRYKVRIRRYLNTGEQYLELKKKSNTGLMEKKRMPLENLSDIEKEDSSIICENSPYNFNELDEVVKSEYSRVTFQDPRQEDRLTIDFCLRLTRAEKSIFLPGLGIIEAKKKHPHTQAHISSSLNKKGIFATGFSKYCTGMALLSDKVKYNNFKEKILILKRFENEFDPNNDLAGFVCEKFL